MARTPLYKLGNIEYGHRTIHGLIEGNIRHTRDECLAYCVSKSVSVLFSRGYYLLICLIESLLKQARLLILYTYMGG